MKNNQFGRSMIEMLGVLAIIAVLSVAGLAGYSKAMTMYKLNRYREGVAELLSNFLQVKESLAYEKGGWTQNYPEIFSAMNMLPAEFKRVDSQYMEDEFGHRIVVYHDNRTGSSFNHFGFIFVFYNDKKSSLACQALVETAKSFRNDIWQLYRQPNGGSGIPYYIIYGNNYCSKNSKCISRLTINDIKEICYFYNDKDPNKYRYNLQIIFKT